MERNKKPGDIQMKQPTITTRGNSVVAAGFFLYAFRCCSPWKILFMKKQNARQRTIVGNQEATGGFVVHFVYE